MPVSDEIVRDKDDLVVFHVVPEYRCPDCGQVIALRPCSLCLALREARKNGRVLDLPNWAE